MYVYKCVVGMRSWNVPIIKIVKELAEEGIKISRSSISLFLGHYRETGSLRDAPLRGKGGKLNDNNLKFIES